MPPRLEDFTLRCRAAMRSLRPDPGSLRARLVAIPTMLLLAGLLATFGVIAAGARGRVQAEARSGMALGGQLLTDALLEVGRAPDPDRAFAALTADLPRVRHVTFAAGDGQAAPALGLFARALAPEPLRQSFQAVGGGHALGTITMRSNPADEIAEIRTEMLMLTTLLAAIWVCMILVIRAAVTHGLRPLDALGRAFDGLERGERAAMAPAAVTELRRISLQFNRLAAALGRATADNRLLIERLMSVQEAERREIAHELHDEIGPLLFGMRADAACILRWCADGSGVVSGVPARARSLAGHADGLQRINSRMLRRLRPLVLDEMGLAAALGALADDWQARLPATAWTVDIRGVETEPEPGVALAAYRIVQEALTNAARHACAQAVTVTISPAPDALELSVRDDGCGLPGDAQRGFGLLGMTERARQAGGTFAARSIKPCGTLITARLPWTGAGAEAACASC